MLLLPLYPFAVHSLKLSDLSPTVTIHSITDAIASVNFVSKEHLPFAALALTLFLFALLPPVLLLALYPFQSFRSLLFKCLPK